MILKATSVKTRNHAIYLAKHLVNANDNEICEIWDIEGHAKPDDLKSALCDYYDMVKLTRGGRNGLFMISINPEAKERMSKDQYYNAIQQAEKVFGLENQPKAIIRHYKKSRDHIHVVWQTTDVDRRKIKSDIYFFKRKCMKLARSLEVEFGHRQISNIKSTISYDEKERAQSNIAIYMLKPNKRKELIQNVFRSSKNSSDFISRLSKIGLEVVNGETGICLQDKTNQIYNLQKEIKTIDKDKLKQFFSDNINILKKPNRLKKLTNRMKQIKIAHSQKEAVYINYKELHRRKKPKNNIEYERSVQRIRREKNGNIFER